MFVLLWIFPRFQTISTRPPAITQSRRSLPYIALFYSDLYVICVLRDVCVRNVNNVSSAARKAARRVYFSGNFYFFFFVLTKSRMRINIIYTIIRRAWFIYSFFFHILMIRIFSWHVFRGIPEHVKTIYFVLENRRGSIHFKVARCLSQLSAGVFQTLKTTNCFFISRRGGGVKRFTISNNWHHTHTPVRRVNNVLVTRSDRIIKKKLL